LWWVIPFNSNPGKKRLRLVAEKVQESKQFSHLRPVAHKNPDFWVPTATHSLIEVGFHFIRSPKMKRYYINSGCFQFSFSFSLSREKKNRKSPQKNENLQMKTERRFSSCSSSPSPSRRFPFSAKKVL